MPSVLCSAVLTREQVRRIEELTGVRQPALGQAQFVAEETLKATAKVHIWPLLKEHGFTKFGARVACRTVGQAVQIVEVAAPRLLRGAVPPKAAKYFEVNLGLYWPLLRADRLGRNSVTPSLPQSSITTSLLAPDGEQTSPESARESLRTDGLPWLSLFADARTAMAILEQTDWEIYSSMPMMRNIGAYSSTKRSLLLSFFAFLCHDRAQATAYLEQANIRIADEKPPHMQDHLRAWHQHLRTLVET